MDLRPLRSGQVYQHRGDLGAGRSPVVELAGGTEDLQRGHGPLPRRFGTPSVPGQAPMGFPRGAEDIQAVFQGRGRWVLVAGRDDLAPRLGGVRDGELEPIKRRPGFRPGLGRAVGVAAEHGGHARRLDPNQGWSPPKKTASRASVRTREAHAGSRAARIAPARRASAPDLVPQGRMVRHLGRGQEDAE